MMNEVQDEEEEEEEEEEEGDGDSREASKSEKYQKVQKQKERKFIVQLRPLTVFSIQITVLFTSISGFKLFVTRSSFRPLSSDTELQGGVMTSHFFIFPFFHFSIFPFFCWPVATPQLATSHM